MPIIMTQNGQKYYLHYDQVGTLKAISNSNQRVIKKITYDSYGNILNETNQAFNVPFGFAGGLYDSDTKLTRFGYRDYDAYSGKWTAKDPIDFGGGDSNLYGYVLGDPVDFVDSLGLERSYYDQFMDYLVRVNRHREQNEKDFNNAKGKLYKDAGTVVCGVLATDNANRLYRLRKLFPRDIYTGQKGAMVSLATGGKYPGTIMMQTLPSLFGSGAWWLGLEGGFVFPAYYDAWGESDCECKVPRD